MATESQLRAFTAMAREAVIKPGVMYFFPCPVCRARACARKTIRTERLEAFCQGCDIRISEHGCISQSSPYDGGKAQEGAEE